MNEDFFEKGIVEIIDEKSLKAKLKTNKKLRIKMGFDPTRPDIHLGHAVGLRKLKELQDAGHKIIFLIGDYTAKIGDPSGRNTTRPVLTDQEIKENAKTYFNQVGKILDVKKAEVRYNSEWYKKMQFSDILQLLGKFTVAQIIERDDFEKRLKAGADIGMHELLYPLMQAYDSVMLKADVEFGGSDQKFNMLAGRDLQRKMGQTPQDVVMVRLLVGTDGKEKMSKSLNNYIAITDGPNIMFGKVMSIPDSAIPEYYELATDLTESAIEKVKKAVKSDANPRDLKLDLAYEITKLYHGEIAAKKAKEEFIKVFTNKEMPTDIPEVKLDHGTYDILLLLVDLKAVSSSSEARRLIEQGGVKIDEVTWR
jgi:tyrosyl-tRNA synthetase